jgi:hypothetical protein
MGIWKENSCYRTGRGPIDLETKETKLFCIGFEVFTAMTVKDTLVWDLKPQFVPHRRHITSLLGSSRLMLCNIWRLHGGDYEECGLVRFDPVCSCKNRRFGLTSPPSSG